jgi:hypothetical protein
MKKSTNLPKTTSISDWKNPPVHAIIIVIKPKGPAIPEGKTIRCVLSALLQMRNIGEITSKYFPKAKY